MSGTFTVAEIEKRAAILRRLREALLRQRERFSRYLEMLESEDSSDANEIESRAEMEQIIVREIAGLERVIDPLEMMYREHGGAEATHFSRLRTALARTREDVVHHSEMTRSLLKQQIDSLRSEIAGLRVMRRQSVYTDTQPTTIDISA